MECPTCGCRMLVQSRQKTKRNPSPINCIRHGITQTLGIIYIEVEAVIWECPFCRRREVTEKRIGEIRR